MYVLLHVLIPFLVVFSVKERQPSSFRFYHAYHISIIIVQVAYDEQSSMKIDYLLLIAKGMMIDIAELNLRYIMQGVYRTSSKCA